MSKPHSLLFLPGLLCDDRLWRDQVAGLSDIATSVVADLTVDDSIPDMAERALSVAPEKFALIALSMGGYVAFEILRQAPERVTHLALFATSAGAESHERATKRRAALGSLRYGRFAGVTTRMLPQLIHPSRVGAPLGEEVKAMAERVGGEAFVRQQHAILERADSRPLLPSISVPTIVGVGVGDALTPVAESREIFRAIPGASLHVFGHCGHLPALEHPLTTTLLIRALLLDR